MFLTGCPICILDENEEQGETEVLEGISAEIMDTGTDTRYLLIQRRWSKTVNISF